MLSQVVTDLHSTVGTYRVLYVYLPVTLLVIVTDLHRTVDTQTHTSTQTQQGLAVPQLERRS